MLLAKTVLVLGHQWKLDTHARLCSLVSKLVLTNGILTAWTRIIKQELYMIIWPMTIPSEEYLAYIYDYPWTKWFTKQALYSLNTAFLLHPAKISNFWVRLTPGFWEWGNKDLVVTHFAQTGSFQSSGFYHGVKWKQLPTGICFTKAVSTGHVHTRLWLWGAPIFDTLQPRRDFFFLNAEFPPSQTLLRRIRVVKSRLSPADSSPLLHTLLDIACRQNSRRVFRRAKHGVTAPAPPVPYPASLPNTSEHFPHTLDTGTISVQG